MLTTRDIDIEGYEKVIEAVDTEAGLHCFIAIHNTTLGPALGGTRMFPYLKTEDALEDALRLAKAMTYKSALAEVGLGGGKSVIIGDPRKEKTPELLHAFADAVDTLKGLYIAAEDVGTNVDDMAVIRQHTPYVAALPTETSSGDPSRYTAWGAFRGIQAVAEKLWGSRSLNGRKIAVQGLGHVGSRLADLLFWDGAELILTDINEETLKEHAHLYFAKTVAPNEIFSVPCDIFCPCALSGILNHRTIPILDCAAVAGAANAQLERYSDGTLLMERGILYAPDFIINSGGITNAAMEFAPGGYNSRKSRDKVNHIYDTLLLVFNKAEQENKTTSQIANELAEYNLNHKYGKRMEPIAFQ
ncbi:MAG: Glu/Leu/Phe/Val dehydrogenase [Chlamydiales bacterium]|nr:Glu/Leu/Phe/Val dehydrogenase [Chlamydiia bacterium]MCP5507750.1 Glu/Leu/Phe/Val dehydrogenase [Chlamydiales bacterium]